MPVWKIASYTKFYTRLHTKWTLLKKKWRTWWTSNGEERTDDRVVTIYSPLTYRNPCIPSMRRVVERLLELQGMDYKELALAVIDVEADGRKSGQDRLEELFETADDLEYQKRKRDEEDIQNVLGQMVPDLNALTLVTDRPVFYKEFVREMYVEHGLLVQRLPKEEASRVRGNVILDFERALDTCDKICIKNGVCYVPVYKREWEASKKPFPSKD